MSLALDDAGRGSDPLLSRLRELTDVVAQQNATIAALRIERDTVRSEHEAAQAEIEKLRLLIRQLQRNRFGRRSERLDPDQLQLGLEDLEQTVAAAEAALILAHQEIAEGDEIAAAQALIEAVGVRGVLFTADALHGQKKPSRARRTPATLSWSGSRPTSRACTTPS